MRQFFSCAWLLCGGTLCLAQTAEEMFPLKPADIHALIRETAPKIEEKFKGTHAEADGLVERVSEALALTTPPQPDEGDRGRRLAKAMHLMNADVLFAKCTNDGIRGPVSDTSTAGCMQRYRELEAATARDAGEVWRWLEMQEAARYLKWTDQKKICGERALGAARALIAREPKNAAAHALLALALDWGADKLAALQTALRLDARQPLAAHTLLDHRVELAFAAAVLRRDIALAEPEPEDVERALFDRPLAEDERLAFEKLQDELRREAEPLLALAEQRGDLTVYLKTLSLLAGLRRQADKIALAAKRGPEDRYEVFQARQSALLLPWLATTFEDTRRLRTALALTRDDPEAMGTIFIITMLGEVSRLMMAGQQAAPERQELLEQTLAALVARAAADDSVPAARAAEAVVAAEFTRMMAGRPPQHLDLLLRAIRLDPLRFRAHGTLLAMCMMKPEPDLAASSAILQIQLAMLPNFDTRRMCAAASASLHDWPAAHRYLDACLKEKPDDVLLLNQRAATWLRESQSKSAQKKAAALFDKMAPLLQEQIGALSKSDRELLAKNRILFHALCGKNDEARAALAAALENKSLDEKEGKALAPLLK
ncbi:MAG: hypothetical protein ACKVY0_09950 [Prosthecobacter sp.]|uniref:hypothetical protein n=1 Tax=Prosthecobacter sp. TaxID=1965333 RepID=UPI003903AD0B